MLTHSTSAVLYPLGDVEATIDAFTGFSV